MKSKFAHLAARALAAGVVLTAIGCAEMSPESSGSSGSALRAAHDSGASTQSADSSAATGGSANTGFAGGPAKQNGGQPGGAATDESGGIGLKPGGAQDIAFFRSKLQAKMLPKGADMTLEGFLNEHDTVLPPAQKDRVISLHALAGVFQPAGGKPQAVVQLGLNSAKKLADVQTSLALTIVIDRSGSMGGQKMADVKAGLHEMANHLPKGTRLGIVSFASEVKTSYAAKVIDSNDLPALHQAIDGITADGGTNIYGGLQEGQKTCFGAGNAFQNKRILFLSDGQATAGNTKHADIVALTKATASEGCSVSTVGVGLNFDLKLMTEMAQVGNGTAWFVQNSDHAKAVFVQDMETMLLPVAEKLWMKFSVGDGWKVLDIPGFEWAIEGDKVTITGTKKATATTTPEGSNPPPQTDPTAKVAMPTLFASKKNGIVMLRLQAPDSIDPNKFSGLLLSTVEYGYSIAKTGAQESFAVPVQVPGLTAIPDGGWGYFQSPIVRRTFVLLHVGMDLIDACKLAEAGQKESAIAIIDASAKLVAGQVKEGGAELAAVDKTAPDLADAAQLLAALKSLIP